MTELSIYWQHLIARWKPILGLVCFSLFLGLVTFALTFRPSDSSRPYVVGVWPDRLSESQEGVLQLHVQRESYPAKGAIARLMRYKSDAQIDDPARFIAKHGTDDFVEVSRGVVDEQGSLTLAFPPVSDVAEPGKLLRGDHGAQVVLEVEHEGKTTYLTHTISDIEDGVLALSFDRPLYQPGQTARMRAILVDADSGEPRADVPVSWQVHDPKGDLLLDESGATSAHGVAHTDIAIAPQGRQGAYSVKITAGNVTVSRDFEVRPFRLPRYTVEARSLQTPLPRDGVATLEVVATYTYGERVANADVKLSVSAPMLHGQVATREFEGKTDKSGTARFTYTTGRDLKPGGALSLDARVSIAGRSETGSARVDIEGRSAGKVELVRAGRAQFIANFQQRAYVIVSDSQNKPIEGALLEIPLPEEKDVRMVKLQTDAKGRAEFEWSPRHGNHSISIRARIGRSPWQTFHQRVQVSYDTAALSFVPATASVGEPLVVELDTFPNAGAIVLVRRGLPVASAVVPRSAGPQKVEIVPPANASGLCELVLMGQGNQRIDGVPVWVRQRGAQEIAVTIPGEDHRPGMQAEIELSYDPGEAKAEIPVTYGLVGVDEALYALQERAEAPLWTVLRQEPATLSAILDATDQIDSDDRAAVEIATSKFQLAVGTQAQYASSSRGYYSSPRDLSYEITRHRRANWQRGFSMLLLLLFFGLGMYGARHTWRCFSRGMVSGKRIAAMIAVTVGALVLFFGIAVATRGDGLAGALLLWCLLLAGLLIEAMLREPDSGLPRWFGILLAMVVLASCAAISEDAAMGRTPDWFEYCAGFCILVPVALLFIECLIWPLVLIHNEQRQAGLALVTLAVSPLIIITGMMSSGGRHNYSPRMEKMAMATGQAFEEDRVPEPSPEKFEEGERSLDTTKPGASQGDAPRVRSYFPETMVWIPELHSDPSGKAKTKVELPDSITTWRIDAWAHTADGRFAQGRGALRVWQPFFVELELPTELTQGDIVTIPVSLVNRHDAPVDLSIDALAEGSLLIQGPPEGNLTLDAMERRVIMLDVVAQRVGDGAVTVSASIAGGEGDAVKREVRVAPDGRVVKKSAARLIREPWTHPVSIPGDAIPGTTSVDVQIAPGPVAEAISGLASMLREPYGCFEQTSSANYPNIMILRALKKSAPENWPGGKVAWTDALARAQKFASLGYQRILTFQNQGGFALYPDNEPTIMLTAYGILQLKEMATVIKVDPKVIARAEAWLIREQNPSGSWPTYAGRIAGGDWRASDEDIGQVRATSFVLLALATNPSPEYASQRDRAADHILSHVERVQQHDALALAASALLAAGRKPAAKKILDRLANAATRDKGGAYMKMDGRTWMGSTAGYANIEATAITASAMLTAEVHADLLTAMLHHVIQAKSPYGGWGSTQATVWVLRMLEKLSPASKEPVDITLQIDGAAIQHADRRGEPGRVTISPSSMLTSSFHADVAAGTHLLSINPSGETSASAQAITTYAVPWYSPNARVEDAPFEVRVSAPSVLSFGQTSRVEVAVSNASQSNRAASIVELPSLPGAAIDRDVFDAMVQQGAIDSYEILPTTIRVYLSGFGPDQTRTFAYDVTPMLRGDFSLTPASAWRFYTPTPRAFADGGDVSVR